MTVSRHKNLNPQAPERRGAPVEIATFGGQAFVVNTNSASAASDPDDLYENLSSTTAVIIPVAGGSYLGLTHQWTDVVAATVNQAPVVRVFGKVRNPEGTGVRYHPQDLDSDFPDVHSSSYLDSDNTWDARGLWVPLTTPGYTLGTPQLTLSNIGIRHLFSSDANQYVVSEEQYVFLAGVEEVLVIVNTAATWNLSSDPKGLIVGRLYG